MFIDLECHPEPARAEAVLTDIWYWDLDAREAEAGALETWLSTGECERVAAFATPELQNRWRTARAGLRGILADYLGVSPRELVFETGPHGKPYLVKPDCPCSFNLSHSANIAVLAVSVAPVGVDVEQIGALPEGVAEAFFSEGERTALKALPEAAQADAFYRCWTAKEALLKGLGAGMSLPGSGFTVGFTGPEGLRLAQADWPEHQAEGWQLRSFETVPGFAGTVAVKVQGEMKLQQRRWNFIL